MVEKGGIGANMNCVEIKDQGEGLRVSLIRHTPDAKRVAFAAIRSCYSAGNAVDLFEREYEAYVARAAKNGEGDDAERLIREIMASGHTSTLEHVMFTFGVEGLSRAALAQLTRHRVGWSYSVQSQRYVKQNSGSRHGEVEFRYPELGYLDAGKREKAGWLLGEYVNDMQDTYDKLVGLGVRAEDARAVLGQGSCCNLVVSCNLRAFLDFWEKRKPGTHAQAEIQELAVKMKNRIVEAEPWVAGLLALGN